MDAHAVYMAYSSAENKKDQVEILCDQNPMLDREQMLDVLEDLGFRVGNMRKKEMTPEAKEKWYKDHPNRKRREAPLPSVSEKPEAKPLVLTIGMLDIANKIVALRLEIAEAMDNLDLLVSEAEKMGIVIDNNLGREGTI